MDPDLALLIRLTRQQLVYKARVLHLSIKGTKIELAQRIALEEKRNFDNRWKTIVRGG